MIERGGSRTDWERIRAMTDEAVEAAIADEPDEPVWDEAALSGVVLARPGNSFFVQLDADLVKFYRAQGPDWQARINDVLRAHQHALLKL